MKEESSRPSIDRLADLQKLIAALAQVKRTNKLVGNDGLENDVEHSYSLALTCWFLHPYIAPELNLATIIKYALLHDLVEVYAGDYHAIRSPEEQKKKKLDEQKALQKLEREWNQDFPELINTLIEYDKKPNEEAWYVYSVDKILPALMINLHEKEEYYQRLKLDKETLFQNTRLTMGKSKHVSVYIDRYLEWLDEKDYYYKK